MGRPFGPCAVGRVLGDHEKVDASYGIYTTGKHMKAIYNRFANAGLRAEIDLADKGTPAQ